MTAAREPGREDCGAEAAAYALGALPHDEAERFRRHLQSCAVCRDEVSSFNAVVTALPLGAPPQAVPRSLKRRVMEEVRTGQRRAVPNRRRSRWTGLIPAPALAAGLAAVAAVVAIALGGLGGGAEHTRVIQARVAATGASAQLRITGGHAELIVQRMPTPPSGKVYEVWLHRPAHPPVATNALFSVTAGGSGAVDVPGNLHGVDQMMVTAEPAGGSKVPTSAPVLVARIA